jgi:hypothetical protein
VRSLYMVGTGFTAICLAIIWFGVPRSPVPIVSGPTQAHAGPTQATTSAPTWFQAAKPFCNALEVETRMQAVPPPATADGSGWAAACYALAGKIGTARSRILDLPAGQRGRAASILFQVGHPVADAGDDESAGPMMELVLEFWPQNYMARYHAGISAYELGDHEMAAEHLAQFLDTYHQNDGWRRNAEVVLARLEQS